MLRHSVGALVPAANGPRLRCCVPFCRRTAKAVPDCDGNFDEDQEMVCRNHGKGASKQSRLIWQRLYKKADRLQQKDPDICSEAERRYILRVIALEKKAWARFKTSAIESAMGLQ